MCCKKLGLSYRRIPSVVGCRVRPFLGRKFCYSEKIESWLRCYEPVKDSRADVMGTRGSLGAL